MNRPPLADRKRSANARRDRRNRKRRDPLLAIRLLLVLALIGETLHVAFASPRLRLTSITVSGTQRISRDEVLRLAGIRLGQNIFRVNIVKVVRRLKAHPLIGDAVVARALPNAITVELHERQPAFQLAAGDRTLNADAEGIVFEQAPASPGTLPRLELPAKDVPALGGKVRPEWKSAVQECVRLARREKLGLGKMRVDDHGELWLNIAPSLGAPPSPGAELQVRVGRVAGDLAEKFRDIHQALAARPDLVAKAEFLNVMCAGRPAYRPVSETKTSRE